MCVCVCVPPLSGMEDCEVLAWAGRHRQAEVCDAARRADLHRAGAAPPAHGWDGTPPRPLP